MKERPILFSGAMVRAILNGPKTQTRRIVKPQPDVVTDDGVPARFTPCDAVLGRFGEVMRCPYGQPDDRLWVREAWRAPKSVDDLSPKGIGEACVDAGYREPWCPIQYEADGARTSEKDWQEFGSHPSISVPGRYRHARFMPRWASRITLEVTGVRVERLHDISCEDSIAEGLREDEARGWFTDDVPGNWASPVAAYRALWESINGQDSWDQDPFVWVIEFKRVTP